jgi:16S rRNA (cytosine1402-N4)-methyltransferase
MILEACRECRLLAVDRDPQALEEAAEVLAPYRARVRLLAARFDAAARDIEVRDRGLDGALLDLGVSSRQLDQAERGFTFGRGAPLDMRMGRGREDVATAADLLNGAPVEELARLFHDYGEVPGARRLAREIAKRRETEPFRTSDELVAALRVVLGRSPSMREKARVFQALRIAVNDEIESLTQGLPALRDVLNDGAVLVVIAYHSLEDRIAKHAFREWSRSCICPPELPVCRCRGRALGETLTRSPVQADDAEVERNPRARSARLRAWRKAA